MMVAGETSGDVHGSCLIKAIRDIIPQAEFSGLGGPRMKEMGMHLYYDLTRIAVVGFQEVLKNLMTFKKLFNLFLREAERIRPDCVVLIDYPGFNLALVRRLKRLQIKTVYYILPQVWAWHKSRIEIIRRCVDKRLAIFQFEKEFYKKEGIEVDYVGHPLLDIVRPSMEKKEVFTNLGLSFKRITIALLPGSRRHEVKTLLPIMLESAKLIRKEVSPTQFVILRSETVKKEIFDEIVKKANLKVSILEGKPYDGLNIADFCIVASGTATLEAAIMEKPMVVIYKISPLTSLLARRLIKIPNIALVNVVAAKTIVPELIQSNATPQKIARTVTEMLSEPEKIITIRRQLQDVKKFLQPSGASQRAAGIITDFIK